MADSKFGSKLRAVRSSSGKTVPEISAHLISLGYKASEKTIYSWESGRSQPTPDAFLELCEFCNTKNIMEIFGYEKTPDATEIAPGEGPISLDKSNELLVSLGYIKENEQLSDADLTFLAHIIALLDSWFDQRR